MPACSLRISCAAASLFLVLPAPARAAIDQTLHHLSTALPAAPGDFTADRVEDLARLAIDLEAEFASQAQFEDVAGPQAGLARVGELLDIKARVDRLLDQSLALRGEFTELPAGEPRRALLRNYLRATSTLIDLSGRLRYTLFDALNGATLRVVDQAAYFEQLVDLLLQHRSSIGASVVARGLYDATAPRQTLLGRRQDLTALQRKILELIAVTGETTTLPTLVTFLNRPTTSPELKLAAAETIRAIGLPQVPRPEQDATLPKPPITAPELYQIVAATEPRRLSRHGQQQREQLLAWLATRAEQGLVEDRYRLGNFTVEGGDWLLMRNPSPYNRFTDLAPGLFTHVGVITTETGSDGVRRMVLVDLPERGDEIQATNLETYVLRTLHYVVVRHKDPQVAGTMAKAARSVIGNPSQFDLNFRTDRVAALRGQPLAGRKIHTYCAGLLLLCAQETAAPRSDFFPIPEFPAGGKTEENLAQLGLTFGDHFISPTGAIFSPQLKVVGRQESMYDPSREAREAVFDHFANSLIDRTLTPSPDLFQSLRLKLAEAAETNPLIAQALASAAGVVQDTDLVAAARTAAVIEALDEIANRASRGFVNARRALLAGPEHMLPQRGFAPADIAAINAYRERHAALYQQLAAAQISPRQLRLELLQYYMDKGRRELDERFFHAHVQ